MTSPQAIHFDMNRFVWVRYSAYHDARLRIIRGKRKKKLGNDDPQSAPLDMEIRATWLTIILFSLLFFSYFLFGVTLPRARHTL